MAGKSGNQRSGRHVPHRTCVGCRAVQPKRRLIRIVRTETGVFIDQTGKMNGRGAYLHDALTCWEKALKGPLSNALRVELKEDDRQRLLDFAATLSLVEKQESDTPSENPMKPA